MASGTFCDFETTPETKRNIRRGSTTPATVAGDPLTLFPRNRVRRPVAVGAFSWSGLVEENRLAGNEFRQLVAIGAAYILMGATQRKIRPVFMVKERRLPLHAVMAIGTWRGRSLGELFPMDILVAAFALRRRGLEIHVDQFGFEVRRLVAVDTSRGTMRA